jgi:sulfotransferase
VKTIHYLSGLPRSGNTVLSALLNQNPKIYSSPISPLIDILETVEMQTTGGESFIRSPNESGLSNVLKNVLNNYYSNVEKEIIFDREKCWTTPDNLNRIKRYVNPTPKILFTVRNTLDILKSYIIQSNKHPFLERYMEIDNYLPRHYLSKNDAICDYIVHSQMTKPLLGLYNALSINNRPYVHFVDYDDLINNPTDTMKQIYLFLELDYFNHEFNHILTSEKNDELAVHQPQSMHQVHPVLKHYSPPAEEVLSQYILDKYKNSDLWRKLI